MVYWQQGGVVPPTSVNAAISVTYRQLLSTDQGEAL